MRTGTKIFGELNLVPFPILRSLRLHSKLLSQLFPLPKTHLVVHFRHPDFTSSGGLKYWRLLTNQWKKFHSQNHEISLVFKSLEIYQSFMQFSEASGGTARKERHQILSDSKTIEIQELDIYDSDLYLKLKNIKDKLIYSPQVDCDLDTSELLELTTMVSAVKPRLPPNHFEEPFMPSTLAYYRAIVELLRKHNKKVILDPCFAAAANSYNPKLSYECKANIEIAWIRADGCVSGCRNNFLTNRHSTPEGILRALDNLRNVWEWDRCKIAEAYVVSRKKPIDIHLKNQ